MKARHIGQEITSKNLSMALKLRGCTKTGNSLKRSELMILENKHVSSPDLGEAIGTRLL